MIFHIIGLSVIAVVVGAILISFYFRKKEEYEDGRLERKAKKQDEAGG